jgi:thioredoxin reductase
MPPADLLAAGRTEVAGYGGHLIDGTVVAARACDREGFRLSLADGRELSARRLLVTTGLHDELPDLPGVRQRWGRDLLHCPYCHGHEVRDQPLGVLGGSPEAVAHALLVRQWSADVVFFVHTGALTTAEREQLTARAVGVVEGAVRRLVVEGDRLQGVELEDGRVVPRTAVFVRPRFVPHGDLLDQLGCATHENGWVVADPAGHTTVPGVWAAGNAVNPRAQVVTAAGEGSAAGIDINADLVRDDVTTAVRDFRAGLPA